MAKRLQELSLLNGAPRGQARLLIKDNPTGFLEDYSISVSDFKADLVYKNEVSTSPTVGQIPRLVSANGVPALPAISAKNLLHIKETIPLGTGSSQGLLKLSDSISSTSGVGGGVAATPLAVRQINLAKPNISGATITGAWKFNAGATFNNATVTGTATLNEVLLNGNIVSSDALTIATTGNDAAITIAAGNIGNTSITLQNNGNLTVRGNLIAGKAPTSGNHLTNKDYVDNFDSSIDNNLVHKTGSETISGSKKFTSTISVEVERVALELKAANTQNSVIVDYGNHTSDYVVRQEVMLPNSPQYGQIKLFHTSDVPQENREMYLNSNKIFHQGNDGAGSGLDADLLDGKQSDLYVQADIEQTIIAQKTFTAQTHFYNTVNMNTSLVTVQPASGSLVPVLKMSGQADVNNQIAYLQFESRNGGGIGGSASTKGNLSVSKNFELNWNGRRILTTDDGGNGNGLDADKLDGFHASDFVKMTGAQSVNGNKTFNSKITINNSTNTNKQFEITGAIPSINLSPSSNANPHYRIQAGNAGDFNILRDTGGNDNFNVNVMDITQSGILRVHGKTCLNVTDSANINGSFTFDKNSRINLKDGNNYLGTNAATGSPILSSTGEVTIISNSNNAADNQPVVIRSSTNKMYCSLNSSTFTVNTDQSSLMANFYYRGESGSSIVRFTGKCNPDSSNIVSQLQSFNNQNATATSLLFKADGLLEYSGTGIKSGFVDCEYVSLVASNGGRIPNAGDICYVSNFNTSQANGTPSTVWGADGGGLLIRGEDGLAGVLDSKNMFYIAPSFKGLTVSTGGFNVSSLANFKAGNKDYITSRNVADAAVNVDDSDIVNVNGLHFGSGASGITFYRSGAVNLPSSYSSLLIDTTGVRYKKDSTSNDNQYCAMLTSDAGIPHWSITTPNDENYVRTPVSGLLPFAPSDNIKNTSTLGTGGWRFKAAHVDTVNCYSNLILSTTNSALITSQYTNTNGIFINVRARSSLSVGGFVNSAYNFQIDDSGSGIRLQCSVTPTGAVGNDNMFSVKASDGKPKLYVGAQRTGTQNSNFYVGVDNNGTGGQRVIHEGDGGKLLTAEAII